MSTRQDLLSALKARLASASALGEISYWRDCRMESGTPATTFRDVSSQISPVSQCFEHNVRVEIESYCYGADLGTAMNTQLATILGVLSTPIGCVLRVRETQSEIVGEGHEVGVVGVVLDLEFRTTSFST